jgi:hypothetical protein
MSKVSAITPAMPTRPTTVNVPATAPVLEKKPEEEDWVAVAEAEAVTVADVMTTTDEGADTPATSATVVGVEGGDVCCCATVTGADEVDGAAEVDPVDGEGVEDGAGVVEGEVDDGVGVDVGPGVGVDVGEGEDGDGEGSERGSEGMNEGMNEGMDSEDMGSTR